MSASKAQPRWVTTFQASPAAYDFKLPDVLPKELEPFRVWLDTMRPQPPVAGTLRQRLGITVGGAQVRVRFSNEVGTQSLQIASASIALAGQAMNAVSGSVTRLTFGGKTGISIPAGAPALSDPVNVRLVPFSEVVVSAYLPSPVDLTGGGAMSLAPKDQVLEANLTDSRMIRARPLVSGVVVLAEPATRVVVTMGDSLTDGGRIDPATPRGWAGVLARRLSSAEKPALAVANAGIGGNRLLRTAFGQAALTRFDRDVLAVPGVSHVVLLEGTNDIGFGGPSFLGVEPYVEAGDLIAAYLQLIARAHEHGLRIIGATMAPFGGGFFYSEDKEKVRLAVNDWIRTSGAFDQIIDFDAVLRDANAPSKLKAEFDSGDHMHPNDAGFEAMGKAVDLSLFD